MDGSILHESINSAFTSAGDKCMLQSLFKTILGRPQTKCVWGFFLFVLFFVLFLFSFGLVVFFGFFFLSFYLFLKLNHVSVSLTLVSVVCFRI